MNNYLGIGMDAKIAYEFHNRREERLSQYMYVFVVYTCSFKNKSRQYVSMKIQTDNEIQTNGARSFSTVGQ